MLQKQKQGTVWEDNHGRKYTDVVVKPHVAKINPDGSLFLQAGFYFDEDALDNEPFYTYSILFSKEPILKEFVPKKDENGVVLLDENGTPLMDFEKTTFIHVGGPRITQNLRFNYPIETPLAYAPLNRASQLAWNEMEFYNGLKFGDYFEFENGLLLE